MTKPTQDYELLRFLFLLGKLKSTTRIGWTRYPDIKLPESVADHGFRCAAMAMLLAPKHDADPGKTTMMLILHDIGVAVTGDVVTDGGKVDLPNREEKLKAKHDAAVKALTEAGADEYVPLYDEFFTNETAEAKLANQIDKLEMGLQAREYELKYKVSLQPFYDSAQRRTFNDLHDLQLQIEKYTNN